MREYVYEQDIKVPLENIAAGFGRNVEHLYQRKAEGIGKKKGDLLAKAQQDTLVVESGKPFRRSSPPLPHTPPSVRLQRSRKHRNFSQGQKSPEGPKSLKLSPPSLHGSLKYESTPEPTEDDFVVVKMGYAKYANLKEVRGIESHGFKGCTGFVVMGGRDNQEVILGHHAPGKLGAIHDLEKLMKAHKLDGMGYLYVPYQSSSADRLDEHADKEGFIRLKDTLFQFGFHFPVLKFYDIDKSRDGASVWAERDHKEPFFMETGKHS